MMKTEIVKMGGI